ncbi:hypothetical protein KIN20_012082 [Parelaphostrongylus tenuis]|uniref:Uncharacterized protein n=1 Tax=Parelaphostrongylus tenuis TaxID=148309 RepID=A0AAD5MAD3_PARTN|nr:hypothetical protein KIN20_002644 [Parelaphostrongylus tenuis]KAJ1354975.1 hypothetical protein KIN20_012082 [Parelaphostrongylus tenuis]
MLHSTCTIGLDARWFGSALESHQGLFTLRGIVHLLKCQAEETGSELGAEKAGLEVEAEVGLVVDKEEAKEAELVVVAPDH